MSDTVGGTLLLRALEPSDLPALEALCARPEIAAALDERPSEKSLQGAPGVNAAVGAFEAGRLVGAAGMRALDRPRLRHAGHAWLASDPVVAVPLLGALRGLARDWWKLDRLDVVVPAAAGLGEALAAAGFEAEVTRRADLAGPGGLGDSVEHAWIREGVAATRSGRVFPRRAGGPLPATFTIRPSTPEDAPGFARVFADESAVWGTLQSPFTPVEAWRARLAAGHQAGAHSFVAAVGHEMVACCNLAAAGSPRRGHVRLLGMAVADAWQGRGVGRAMMRHLTGLADSLGAVRVELDVYADNDRAVALYRSFGFEREGVKRIEAWRDGAYVDALVMARLR